MPMPVGDGIHAFHFLFDSRTVNTTPSTENTTSATSAEVDRAPTPSWRICANPDHLFEIGEVSCAVSPVMPH